MLPHLNLKTFCILGVLLIIFTAGCGKSDIDKANKLVHEGNDAMVTADKFSQDGLKKFRSYMSDATMANFPSNRDQIKGAVQEAADLFVKAASAYRDAANKFEEVAKLNVPEKFKEYATLKAQGLQKLAESRAVGKELAEAPLDQTTTTTNDLIAKVKAIDARLNSVVKEAQEINERAKKIQQDNPDVIGKSPS